MLDFLLDEMADGRFHSGQALATRLGVSRAAVWKAMQRLETLGLEVHSVRGRGYRIADGLDLLDAEKIQSQLGGLALAMFGVPRVELEVASTNTVVMEAVPDAGPFTLLAERQSAGRGRLGRQWVSPFAANIYLSLVYRQNEGAHGFEGLSLIVGLACARALQKHAGSGPLLGLKWPNDLVVGQRKLGGILIELAGDLAGPSAVVIGIGINVHMSKSQGCGIDQPWICMDEIAGERLNKNDLVVSVMNELALRLQDFDRGGFLGQKADWELLDSCAQGAEVSMLIGDQEYTGHYLGVNERGGVQLQTVDGVRDYYGGELSLRVGGT